jgi:hypothetical protein
MSYENEYLKYKKLYEDLKKQNNISTESDNFTDKISQFINKHFSYDTMIDRLENYCRGKYSTPKQIEDKIVYLYQNFDSKRLDRNNLDMKHVLDYIRSGRNDKINWERYHRKMCEYIKTKLIPELKREKELYNNFMNKIKEMPEDLKKKIDVDKYIQFARHNNLLDKTPYEIITKYSQKLNKLINHAKDELNSNQQISDILNRVKSSIRNIIGSGPDDTESDGETKNMIADFMNGDSCTVFAAKIWQW